MKKGLLLINLGTPEASSVDAVRTYLDEFLMDPYVIDLPYPLRYLLVKGIILRKRPQKSALLYRSVWTEEGSPLLVLSLHFTAALQQMLQDEYVVEIGMRYGTPSIQSALEKLLQQPLQELIVLPLFPQYSQAATLSAINCFKRTAKKHTLPPTRIIDNFYNHPMFIEAYAAMIRDHYDPTEQHLLMSYHGLPVRHLEKIGCAEAKKICAIQACPPINTQNKQCYRAQCFTTSRLLATQLHLKPEQYSVSFQSRLGKTPWIKPYTDLHLPDLYAQGIRNLAVVCPSFVTDCLETREEIALRAKEQWMELGGESFTAIPCLNSSALWLRAVCEIITHQLNTTFFQDPI